MCCDGNPAGETEYAWKAGSSVGDVVFVSDPVFDWIRLFAGLRTGTDGKTDITAARIASRGGRRTVVTAVASAGSFGGAGFAVFHLVCRQERNDIDEK